jgi:hypothetical protein
MKREPLQVAWDIALGIFVAGIRSLPISRRTGERSGTRRRRWWRAPVFAASAPCLQTLPATRRGSWRSGRPRLRWPFTRNGGTRLTATVRLPAAVLALLQGDGLSVAELQRQVDELA